jgi:hypothetical protein
MTIYKRLAEIQQTLKAPKSQHNKFGGYKYRNCEDILQAVKPLLGDLVLTLNDTITQIGDRYYIQATATLSDGDASITATAYAREEEVKKGMDSSQITGSASSYARKYALNGLLAIDDTKDADNHAPDNNTEAAKELKKVIGKQDADKQKEVLDWIKDKYGSIEKMPSAVIEQLQGRLAA